MVWKSCRNGTSIEIMFLSLEKKKKKKQLKKKILLLFTTTKETKMATHISP